MSATDFGLTDEQREQLYLNGRAAAEQFLDGDANRPPWNPDEYVEMMTSGPSPDDFGGAGGDLALAQG